ncbi:hypothetical protein BpHYR1_043840 [Brachionus plicatilis]|uniref:Uncharacterized protein n=1 Tax=Brachionus plicatilis TaxID=10195 RepID=A0A3M7PET2_BRAPC|nr:hypothetical protein BpHYR1_043840 [Brachionus plicatilis]
MPKITPQNRISQFNNKELSVKKQKFYCVACDQELDHLRKSIIESHLLTPKHIQNSKSVASHKALDFSEENSRIFAAFFHQKKNAFLVVSVDKRVYLPIKTDIPFLKQ